MANSIKIESDIADMTPLAMAFAIAGNGAKALRLSLEAEQWKYIEDSWAELEGREDARASMRTTLGRASVKVLGYKLTIGKDGKLKQAATRNKKSKDESEFMKAAKAFEKSATPEQMAQVMALISNIK